MMKPLSERGSRPNKSFVNSQENTCARVSFPVNFAKLLRTPFLQNNYKPMFLSHKCACVA